MGKVPATVTDASEIRAFECLLPDDAPVSRIAARLAELTRLPLVGHDNFPIRYGLVAKGGVLLDLDATLGELGLAQPLTLRLVPEIVVTEEVPEGHGDSEVVAEPQHGDDVDIEISEPLALLHEVELGLCPDVRIDARLHREIEEYAEEDRHTECAGLLLGTVSAEAGERVIHASAIAAAVGALGSRSSVKFTLETWRDMLRVRDVEYPELRILGWFHAHAGWGVFMSDADVFFHRHFFPHPNMVAYVLDPTVGSDGFFFWHEGKISLCPSYGLVGTPDEVVKHKTRRKVKSRTRPDLRDGIIAVLLILTLYFGLLRPADVKKPEPSPTASGPAPASAVRPHLSPSGAVRPSENKDRVYKIARGDTLWQICDRIYGDGRLAKALAEYNNMESHTQVRAGQQIRLPPKEVLEQLANQ